MTAARDAADVADTPAETSPSPSPRSLPSRALDAMARHPLRTALWLAFVIALPVVLTLRARASQALPVYGTVPAFTLTSQADRPFGLSDLRGHVWVADFFFTSCPSICPRLTRHLKRVQDRTADLGDRVRIVSFSVDPVVDTPAQLDAYARRYGADAHRWTFLAGPIDAVQRVAVDGFRVALEANLTPVEARDQQFNILHGGHILLVDGDGRIRGYYRANDEDLDAVVDAARRLASR